MEAYAERLELVARLLPITTIQDLEKRLEEIDDMVNTTPELENEYWSIFHKIRELKK